MSIAKKIKKILPSPKELAYLEFRKNPIVEKTILFECSHGREISGHIYALINEIQTSYPEYEFYIAVKKGVVVSEKFRNNIVQHGSISYLKKLATSQILINDTSFWSFFHKRTAQQYYLFWHGTPLKCLGKSTQVQGYGNVQRNLAAANQVFVSNQFTYEKLANDFGIAEIVDNEFVIAPSPRNSYLFKDRVKKGRYLYMPTWRGVDVSQVAIQEKLYDYLKELDEGLSGDEEMYIKLHPYEEALLKFQQSNYQHLKLFPKNEDVYEFLQTVEKLITDYSSIMFDFALTKREILLFTYDKEEYISNRGMYLPFDELPFPQFTCVDELLKALKSPSLESDYSSIQEFISRDSKDGTKIVLDYLFKKHDHQEIERISNWNQKENVLIYAYQLADNGITASLLNLFKEIDLSERNYILIWQEGMIPSALEYKIKELPEGIHTLIQMEKVQATISETAMTLFYMNGLPSKKSTMIQMYQRDIDRCFPNVNINYFIHYPGYDRSYSVWTWALQPLGVSTMIFVHTDMEKEFQVNSSLKKTIIYDAYAKADHVVCVSIGIEKKIVSLVPSAKTIVMNVLLNEKEIQKRASTTKDLMIPPRLNDAFDSNQVTVFISVGRYSKQKGYDRLITAFEKIANQNTRLVLICSYGPEKEKIKKQIKESCRQKDIYLFEQHPNPYALVKKADVFVLSSRYEGLGMVVFEALALNKPVIMTHISETLEIIGPEESVTVVDNSVEGLYFGLSEFKKHESTLSNFNFDAYKEKNLKIWSRLFNKN